MAAVSRMQPNEGKPGESCTMFQNLLSHPLRARGYMFLGRPVGVMNARHRAEGVSVVKWVEPRFKAQDPRLRPSEGTSRQPKQG